MSKETLKTRDIAQSLRDLMFRKKLKIFILDKLGDTYKIVETGKAKTTTMRFKRRKRDYIIELTKAILDRNNAPMLFYLKGNAHALSFHEHDKTVDPEQLHTMLQTKKLRERLGGQQEFMYLMIIIALVVAVVGISLYTLQAQQRMLAQIQFLKDQLARILT